MTTAAAKPAARAWFPLEQCAAALNVTRQTFGEVYRPMVPADAIRNAGRKGVEIHLRKLIDAVVEKRATDIAASKSPDPLLVGDGSPWLEEYRKQRAKLAGMDVQEREKTHVNLAKMDAVLVRMAAVLVRAAEALQRRFGKDAFEILDDALSEWRSQWERWRKQNEGGRE